MSSIQNALMGKYDWLEVPQELKVGLNSATTMCGVLCAMSRPGALQKLALHAGNLALV